MGNKAKIKEVELLTDRYGRTLNYLRLSVTDRCNFRCYYCMPEEGMHFASRHDLLSFDEIYQLSALFCKLGVSKIRITGGEPLVRSGIMPFLDRLSKIEGLNEVTLTTNGTLVEQHIAALKRIGIRKINLSLDSLSRERFFQITRRDAFEAVYACVFKLLDAGFELKLNCVLDAGKNIQDIVPFIELTRENPLSIRFLEEMPFNGTGDFSHHNWNHHHIYNYIADHYPEIIHLVSEAPSTSVNYRIPGYQGSFGIISSFTRTFCGTCNRIRLSALGELRTCLYGAPVANLRDLLRAGTSEEELAHIIQSATLGRAKDGFEAEMHNQSGVHQSMSILGG